MVECSGTEDWHGTPSGYNRGCRGDACKQARSDYIQSPEQKARRAATDKRTRESFRAWLNEIKSVPCSDCGAEYPPFVMDLDHRDPALKLFTIADAVYRPRAVVLAEIEKCDIVCSNCHRIRTHGKRE